MLNFCARLVSFLLIPALLLGCSSLYRLGEKPDSPGSLLILHFQLPEGLRVEEAAVVDQKSGLHYFSQFRASHADKDLRGIVAVTDLPPGSYYLGRLVARSKKGFLSQEWLEVNMEFRDPSTSKAGQPLFKLAARDALYGGSIAIFGEDKKKSLIASLSRRYKIPAEKASQSILYETVGHMEATTKLYLFVRMDHPVLGASPSLARKKEILTGLAEKLSPGPERDAVQKLMQ